MPTGGRALRNVDAKNIEESLKKSKQDLRLERQRRIKEEEKANLLQKSLRTAEEKVLASIEYRAKGISEAKRSAESQLQALTASVEDWKGRWSEERAVKMELLREREVSRRAEEDLTQSMMQRASEKQQLLGLLQNKDREIDSYKRRGTLKSTTATAASTSSRSPGRSVQPASFSPQNPSGLALSDRVLRASMSAASAAATAIAAEAHSPATSARATKLSMSPPPPPDSIPTASATSAAFKPLSSSNGRPKVAFGTDFFSDSASAGALTKPSRAVGSPPPSSSSRGESGPSMPRCNPESFNPEDSGYGSQTPSPPTVPHALYTGKEHHMSNYLYSGATAHSTGGNVSRSRSRVGGTVSRETLAQRSQRAVQGHKERMEKKRLEKEAQEMKKNQLW